MGFYYLDPCKVKTIWHFEAALWRFLVNKQKLCLHLMLLTKTHCVYSLGLTNVSDARRENKEALVKRYTHTVAPLVVKNSTGYL